MVPVNMQIACGLQLRSEACIEKQRRKHVIKKAYTGIHQYLPSGKIQRQEALPLQRCGDVIRHTSGREPNVIQGSTDANVPLSLGIPACCVGTIVGDGMHTRGEWIELASLPAGLATILAVMLEA